MLGSVPVLDVPSPRGIRTHLFVPPRVRFRGVVSLEVYPHGVHGREDFPVELAQKLSPRHLLRPRRHVQTETIDPSHAGKFRHVV